MTTGWKRLAAVPFGMRGHVRALKAVTCHRSPKEKAGGNFVDLK
jgi:hypothetical protein